MAHKQWSSPPAMKIDTKKNYLVVMETDRGTIELELYPQYAPKTVNNLVFLAQESYYDGVAFHRVISNFMIQGGDPTGTGRGGPGYRFEDETTPEVGFDEPGLLAMANSGPNTNGSQFFITDSTPRHLDGKHTIFGKCELGVVREILAQPKHPEARGQPWRPVDPVRLDRVEIVRR